MTEKWVVFRPSKSAGFPARISDGDVAFSPISARNDFAYDFRNQALHRDLHRVGIAHKHRAIGIGALHRLDHHVKLLLAIEFGEIVSFKDIEHLNQMNTTGRWRRRGNDVVAAILAAHDRALDRTIICEIVLANNAAGFDDGAGDLRGGAPLVKSAWAIFRNSTQSVGEIELSQPFAFAQRLGAVEKDRCRSRPAREPITAPGSESAVSSSTRNPFCAR